MPTRNPRVGSPSGFVTDFYTDPVKLYRANDVAEYIPHRVWTPGCCRLPWLSATSTPLSSAARVVVLATCSAFPGGVGGMAAASHNEPDLGEIFTNSVSDDPFDMSILLQGIIRALAYIANKVRLCRFGEDPHHLQVACTCRPHSGTPFLLAVHTRRTSRSTASRCRSFPQRQCHSGLCSA